MSDKEKVSVTAIQLCYHYLKDTKGAFSWLERLKGRSFLDALALTPVQRPVLADGTLLRRESRLLELLRKATTQTEIVALNEQLHDLWDQMIAHSDTDVTEYVTLQRGKPVGWKDIVRLLQVHEGNHEQRG